MGLVRDLEERGDYALVFKNVFLSGRQQQTSG
jgi:hypothetical protein